MSSDPTVNKCGYIEAGGIDVFSDDETPQSDCAK